MCLIFIFKIGHKTLISNALEELSSSQNPRHPFGERRLRMSSSSLTLKIPGHAAVSAPAKFKRHAILGFHYFPICLVRLRHLSRLQVLNLLAFFTIFSSLLRLKIWKTDLETSIMKCVQYLLWLTHKLMWSIDLECPVYCVDCSYLFFFHLLMKTSQAKVKKLSVIYIPLCLEDSTNVLHFSFIENAEGKSWFVCVLKSLQSRPTLCDTIDHSMPGSSVHGILQARIPEWVAMPSSRGSSQCRNRTYISHGSCIAGGFFTADCEPSALAPVRSPL